MKTRYERISNPHPFMRYMGQQLRLTSKHHLPQWLLILVTALLIDWTTQTPINAADPTDTFYGTGALSQVTSGFSDAAFGYYALGATTNGQGDTATGAYALFANTTGYSNTANGARALYNNTTGDYNTAAGADALYDNTTGSNNTASGSNALQFNTTGRDNTALGGAALPTNYTGSEDTGTGAFALYSNTYGSDNTASGSASLYWNTTGGANTADGQAAMFNNTTGSNNTATGYQALFGFSDSSSGSNNTAAGFQALYGYTSGSNNCAYGVNALMKNTSGSNNIAIGASAGSNLTTGSNNIDIGGYGAAGESNTIRLGKSGVQKSTFITGIRGSTVAGGVTVMVDSTGRLGTITSSARFKEAIRPMGNASEGILALQPVTFRYKHDLDPEAIPQFGLVAEQVEKVNPNLVARNEDGSPYTVRYDAVNAMLLNEFLKEHTKVKYLEESVAALELSLKRQADQVKKISQLLGKNLAAAQLTERQTVGKDAKQEIAQR